MKIAIVTDSGSGLTKQQAGELGIYYLPLQIIIQDKMFLDGENITVEEIYEYLRNGEMPTTSMPPMGLVEELFIQLKAEGYEAVIAVPLSGGLSSTSSVMQAVASGESACHRIVYNLQYPALSGNQCQSIGRAGT